MPKIDPSFGDQRYLWLQSMALAGNWPAVAGFLASLADPRDVSFYLCAITKIDGSERWLGGVVQQDQSPMALCVYGARLVNWAWEAVSASYGPGGASQQDRTAFKERLRMAEQVLGDSVGKDPDNVAAWAEFMRCSRGLNLGTDETMRRFGEAVARCPDHMRAHDMALQELCEKWHGSHEQMFSFARQATGRAGPGSQLPDLLVQAHLEYWEYLEEEGQGYFRQPAVIQELLHAANMSIWHPNYQPRPDWPQAHNNLALAFSLARQQSYASRLFKQIGDKVTEDPWGNVSGDDAVTNFRYFRDKMR